MTVARTLGFAKVWTDARWFPGRGHGSITRRIQEVLVVAIVLMLLGTVKLIEMVRSAS
jgi:hypothetical protein